MKEIVSIIKKRKFEFKDLKDNSNISKYLIEYLDIEKKIYNQLIKMRDLNTNSSSLIEENDVELLYLIEDLEIKLNSLEDYFKTNFDLIDLVYEYCFIVFEDIVNIYYEFELYEKGFLLSWIDRFFSYHDEEYKTAHSILELKQLEILENKISDYFFKYASFDNLNNSFELNLKTKGDFALAKEIIDIDNQRKAIYALLKQRTPIKKQIIEMPIIEKVIVDYQVNLKESDNLIDNILDFEDKKNLPQQKNIDYVKTMFSEWNRKTLLEIKKTQPKFT